MTGGGLKTPTTPILLATHEPGWFVIRIVTMPTLAGLTVIATRPFLSVTPVLRMPAPRTCTRTPATPLPRRLTTALTVPFRPTSRVRDCTVKVGHTAGGGLNGATTSVGALAVLFAVFVSASAPTTVAVLRIDPGLERS